MIQLNRKRVSNMALDNQILKDLNEFLKKRQQDQQLKTPGSLSKKPKKIFEGKGL